MRRRRRRTALIKSNNPHLAGGEKHHLNFPDPSCHSSKTTDLHLKTLPRDLRIGVFHFHLFHTANKHEFLNCSHYPNMTYFSCNPQYMKCNSLQFQQDLKFLCFYLFGDCYVYYIYAYIYHISYIIYLYLNVCLRGGLGWWFGSLGIDGFVNLEKTKNIKPCKQ